MDQTHRIVLACFIDIGARESLYQGPQPTNDGRFFLLPALNQYVKESYSCSTVANASLMSEFKSLRPEDCIQWVAATERVEAINEAATSH
jgi:hypothetical protein